MAENADIAPTVCDRNCDPDDPRNYRPDAAHYLDCPVWVGLLPTWRIPPVSTEEVTPDRDCTATGFSGEGRCIETAVTNGLCATHAKVGAGE